MELRNVLDNSALIYSHIANIRSCNIALPLGRILPLLYIIFFCGIVATFVSHTVAAVILMPIITHIGIIMHIPEAMTIGSAFASKCFQCFCFSRPTLFSNAVSAAMALPFSSFPNVNSFLIVDDFQRPYLTVQDFAITGIPMTILSLALIGTLGYVMINFILKT
jgi:phosphate transporter